MTTPHPRCVIKTLKTDIYSEAPHSPTSAKPNHTPEFWSIVERLMPGYDLQKTNLAAIGKNVWLGAVAESSA